MKYTSNTIKSRLLKDSVSLSSFNDWVPHDYLKDYYTYVEQDEQHTLKFLVEEFKKIKNRPVALEFGIGPTLHHLLPLSPYVSEIHVVDYLTSNLNEVGKWKDCVEGSHDWTPFTRKVLEYEGNENPSAKDVADRELLTRRRITKFMLGDASSINPIPTQDRKYELVLSCYCADSATSSRVVWKNYMANIASLVEPGGFFVTTALRECSYYKVGGRYFPCANITEFDFERLLRKLDFNMSTVRIIIKKVPEHKSIGYESIVLVSGFKNK